MKVGSADVDDRALVQGIAAARIGLGSAFLLAPRLSLRLWPGHDLASGAVPRLLARSVGGRDLALGIGAILALRHDAPVRGWLEAGILADTADAVAIVAAFRHLPRARASLVLASAVGAVIAGRRVVAALEPA